MKRKFCWLHTNSSCTITELKLINNKRNFVFLILSVIFSAVLFCACDVGNGQVNKEISSLNGVEASNTTASVADELTSYNEESSFGEDNASDEIPAASIPDESIAEDSTDEESVAELSAAEDSAVEEVSEEKTPDVTDKLESLGNPLLERYPDNGSADSLARTIWDMAFFDGKFFISCGNLYDNAGPVPIWSWDDENGWLLTAQSLPEEAVASFYIDDETLYAIGSDATESWEYGNYYIYSDGGWIKKRVLPHGLHCFDMISFHGKLFAGLGVDEGYTPVEVSTDGGNTFECVTFEGADYTGETIFRTFNLFEFGGNLYATLRMQGEREVFDLYKYDEALNVFKKESAAAALCPNTTHPRRIFEYHNLLVTINGGMYGISSDLKSLSTDTDLNGKYVCDLREYGGTIYALTYEETGSVYTSAVWFSSDGVSFTELFSFVWEAPAYSFAYGDGKFIFGMGSPEYGGTEYTGNVLMYGYAE